MKTLNLNEVKNIPQNIYVRWSKSINLDNNRGYSLKYGTQKEIGLSACEIDKTWEDWRIIRQLQEYKFVGGSCWLLSGTKVGTGEDNEPLIVDISVHGVADEELLTANWRKMERKAFGLPDPKPREWIALDGSTYWTLDGRRLELNNN